MSRQLEEEIRMKLAKVCCWIVSAAILDEIPAWTAEGIVSKTIISANYCHLKFPPIREDTLHSSFPVLEPANAVNLIDFYGPCDYDPLGQAEIRRQRLSVLRRQKRDAGNE